ncbi:MAG: YusW family protein [Kurthia sp.]|nr:YusW family protein [Candidatus Kurthia equi]
MKKKQFIYILPIVALLLTACGDSDDANEKDNSQQEKTSKTVGSNDSTENAEDPAEGTTKNEVGTSDSSEDSDDATKNEVGSGETSNESTDNAVGKVGDTDIKFNDLSIEIKYPTGDYSLDYEKEFSGEKAELEDERKNSKITGEEALNNFKPLVKKFNFDANTSDEDVKKQLFSIIKIDDDYTRIEMDVEFSDGVEKEYNFTK